MRPEDVPAAERLSAEGFHELDTRIVPPVAGPSPSRARPSAAPAVGRAHPPPRSRTDPGGCWVAEDDGELVGFADVVQPRADVDAWRRTPCGPGLQGQGIGKALLAAALHHGRGCLRGMLSSSADPKAVRRYHAGRLLAAPADVPDRAPSTGRRSRSSRRSARARAGDVDLMDSVDRRTRGAAHGPDHALLLGAVPAGGLRHHDRVAATPTSTATGTPRCWRRPTGVRRPGCCGSASPTPATRRPVRHVTAANEWAVDVGLAARLELAPGGYLALRGMTPPAPYLHHGSLL